MKKFFVILFAMCMITFGFGSCVNSCNNSTDCNDTECDSIEMVCDTLNIDTLSVDSMC